MAKYERNGFERANERAAIDGYKLHRAYGADHASAAHANRLPLNAAAKRELLRIRRSVAGLAEMQHVAGMQRAMFETNVDYQARQLREASTVRANNS